MKVIDDVNNLSVLDELLHEAKQGNAGSMFVLAEYYEELARKADDKENTIPLWNEAMSWYKRSAHRGNPQAHHNLALIFSKPITDIKERDDIAALMHFEAAADLGYPPSAYNAALYHLNGWGVKKDQGKAIYFFKLADNLSVLKSDTETASKAQKKLQDLQVTTGEVDVIPNLAYDDNPFQEVAREAQLAEQLRVEADHVNPEDFEDPASQFYFTQIKSEQELSQQRRILQRYSGELEREQFKIQKSKQLIKDREKYLDEEARNIEEQSRLLVEQLSDNNSDLSKPQIKEELQQLQMLKEHLTQEKNALEQDKKLLEEKEIRLKEEQMILDQDKKELEQKQLEMDTKLKADEEKIKKQQEQFEAQLKVTQQEIGKKLIELEQESQLHEQKNIELEKSKQELENQKAELERERSKLSNERTQLEKALEHNQKLSKEEYRKQLLEQRIQDSEVIKEKLIELDERERNLQGREAQLAIRTTELANDIKQLRQLEVKKKELLEMKKILDQKIEQCAELKKLYLKAQKATEESARERNLAEKAEKRAADAEQRAREAKDLITVQIKITQNVISPLLNAVRCKDSQLVSQLLKIGYKPNVQDNDLGRTALHLAVSNGDIKTVNVLLAAHADVNILDKNGTSVLHIAAENNFYDLIGLLVKNPHAQSSPAGRTSIKANVKNKFGKLPSQCLKEPHAINIIGKAHCTDAKTLLVGAEKHSDALDFYLTPIRNFTQTVIVYLQQNLQKASGLYRSVLNTCIGELNVLAAKMENLIDRLLEENKLELNEDEQKELIGFPKTMLENMIKEIGKTKLNENQKSKILDFIKNNLSVFEKNGFAADPSPMPAPSIAALAGEYRLSLHAEIQRCSSVSEETLEIEEEIMEFPDDDIAAATKASLQQAEEDEVKVPSSGL